MKKELCTTAAFNVATASLNNLVFVKKDIVTKAKQDSYDNIVKLPRRKDCKRLYGASSCVPADSYYIVSTCYIGTRLAQSLWLQNFIQRLSSTVLPLILTDNCFIMEKLSFGREGEQVVGKLVWGLEVSLDWSFGAGNTMVPPT